MSYWAEACSIASSRPLQAKLNILYACSGLSVVAFSTSALASGYLLARWLQIDQEQRRHLWPLYGRFAALMLCGSLCGVIAWAANLQALVFAMDSSVLQPTDAVSNSLLALSFRCSCAFLIMYAVEFFCLAASKLLVVSRMTQTYAATSSCSGRLRQLLVKGDRLVMVVVAAVNAVGVCSNIVTAVYNANIADTYSRIATAYASNNTDTAHALFTPLQQQKDVAAIIASVQQFCEVAALLFIVVAICIAGSVCARLIGSALLQPKPHQRDAFSQLHRRIVGTVIVVFVTFMLRTAFSTMHAVSYAGQNQSRLCAGLCDSPCNNTYRLMMVWFAFTPEFQILSVVISSPLAMLVALWGMTSERMLQAMAGHINEDALGSTVATNLMQRAAT